MRATINQHGWPLNQMGVFERVLKARGNRVSFRELGRRILKLEIAHQYDKVKCDSLNFV